MAKLFHIGLFVAVLGLSTMGQAQRVSEIAFYQSQQCSGHHFAMTMKVDQCKQVPEWLSEEGWNLSVDPRGNCIKVYENPNCRESVVPAAAYSGYSFNSREEIIKRCRSTVELGFKTVRSVKRVDCFDNN